MKKNRIPRYLGMRAKWATETKRPKNPPHPLPTSPLYHSHNIRPFMSAASAAPAAPRTFTATVPSLMPKSQLLT